MDKEQITLNDLINPPPPNPCDSCGRQINGKCTYPNERHNHCLFHEKWIPKEENKKE